MDEYVLPTKSCYFIFSCKMFGISAKVPFATLKLWYFPMAHAKFSSPLFTNCLGLSTHFWDFSMFFCHLDFTFGHVCFPFVRCRHSHINNPPSRHWSQIVLVVAKSKRRFGDDTLHVTNVVWWFLVKCTTNLDSIIVLWTHASFFEF